MLPAIGRAVFRCAPLARQLSSQAPRHQAARKELASNVVMTAYLGSCGMISLGAAGFGITLLAAVAKEKISGLPAMPTKTNEKNSPAPT